MCHPVQLLGGRGCWERVLLRMVQRIGLCRQSCGLLDVAPRPLARPLPPPQCRPHMRLRRMGSGSGARWAAPAARQSPPPTGPWSSRERSRAPRLDGCTVHLHSFSKPPKGAFNQASGSVGK